MRIVAALGGNALLRRGEPADLDAQRANAARAAGVLGDLAARHELVITHGNGPQIGLLALQSAARDPEHPDPLDVLGAESEGLVGYLLEQALENHSPSIAAATMLTQVVVDRSDPAFESPSKPIGPVYDEATARRLAADRGWSIAPDERWWRRVVASPQPLWTVEIRAIGLLVRAGVTVICAGGGGVPVCIGADGALEGVEAVIDKDLAAAVLAQELEADALLLLTDVDGIEAGHGTPAAHVIAETSVEEVRGMELPNGSMGPKAEASARFAEATGNPAVVCSMEAAVDGLEGRAGTRVTAGATVGHPA